MSYELIQERLKGMEKTARELKVSVDNVGVTMWHTEMDPILAQEPFKSDKGWARVRAAREQAKRVSCTQYTAFDLRHIGKKLKQMAEPPKKAAKAKVKEKKNATG